ncbi:MAG TPA: hypothetical protein VGG37_05920 [Opitutaceae bacterium]
MLRGNPNYKITLEGDPGAADYKEAMSVLDRSGLSYNVRPGAQPTRITWGRERLANFSRSQLVSFLWGHGAQFEDS